MTTPRDVIQLCENKANLALDATREIRVNSEVFIVHKDTVATINSNFAIAYAILDLSDTLKASQKTEETQ